MAGPARRVGLWHELCAGARDMRAPVLLSCVVASLLAAPGSARAQTAALRVISIGGVSPTHAWTPDGVDVLRVRVQNTTETSSRPTEVHCTLGELALRGPVPSLPARSDRWVTLSLPRARRTDVPLGGTFARCNVDARGVHPNTTMVYTGPALVPNLRFDSMGVVLRDCETNDGPTEGHAVCVYLAVENAEQTIGAIGDATVVTRCRRGSGPGEGTSIRSRTSSSSWSRSRTRGTRR